MKYYAIIPAGGAGNRMLSEVPKQFLLLNGKPILMHTLEAFYNSDFCPELTLALNESVIPYWKNLCNEHMFTIPHTLVNGGHNRFESIKNALATINVLEAVIAVHDSVRPLISNEIITGSYIQAVAKGSSVVMIPSRDSVRQISGDVSKALNRDEIFLVQTPQTFKSSILKEAYQQPYKITFTDDASVVESAGYVIHSYHGDTRNIKITFPDDLAIAAFLLKNKA